MRWAPPAGSLCNVNASGERGVSSEVIALGKFTLIDGTFTISGAATMKTISSTSVTSTSGVTLMCENRLPSSGPLSRHQATCCSP